MQNNEGGVELKDKSSTNSTTSIPQPTKPKELNKM